jgi:hypothetical protein
LWSADDFAVPYNNLADNNVLTEQYVNEQDDPFVQLSRPLNGPKYYKIKNTSLPNPYSTLRNYLNPPAQNLSEDDE